MKNLKETERVYDKISDAVEDEPLTVIIGACAAIIGAAIVDSAPDIGTALRAFDALVALTRQKLVSDWDKVHGGPINVDMGDELE